MSYPITTVSYLTLLIRDDIVCLALTTQIRGASMSTTRTIALPDEFEMSLRLQRVDDTPYTIENLHQELIPYARQRISGLGIVTILDRALFSHSQRLGPGIFDINFWMLEYLGALIDDEKVHEDALNELRELGRIPE